MSSIKVVRRMVIAADVQIIQGILQQIETAWNYDSESFAATGILKPSCKSFGLAPGQPKVVGPLISGSSLSTVVPAIGMTFLLLVRCVFMRATVAVRTGVAMPSSVVMRSRALVSTPVVA
jgi:hypothetical protein